jgi:hypothetical protein
MSYELISKRFTAPAPICAQKRARTRWNANCILQKTIKVLYMNIEDCRAKGVLPVRDRDTSSQSIKTEGGLRMKMKARFGLAAVAAAMIISGAPAPARAQAPKSIVVGTGVDSTFAPFVIAVKKGFFAKEASKQT